MKQSFLTPSQMNQKLLPTQIYSYELHTCKVHILNLTSRASFHLKSLSSKCIFTEFLYIFIAFGIYNDGPTGGITLPLSIAMSLSPFGKFKKIWLASYFEFIPSNMLALPIFIISRVFPLILWHFSRTQLCFQNLQLCHGNQAMWLAE